MEHPVRIGAVNYLNTKPLICDLEHLALRHYRIFLHVWTPKSRFVRLPQAYITGGRYSWRNELLWLSTAST
jgi:hypothetical protein